MNLNEFVRLDPEKIRRDKELMQLFVSFHEAAFSFRPNCIGCSFKAGFKKLQKYANKTGKIVKFDKIENKMEAKTFVLKREFKAKIISYRKDGVTKRVYGYNLTEGVARDIVDAGLDVFAKKPEGAVYVKEEKRSYAKMDYRKDILPLYNEIKDRTGRTAKGKKKADIIEFLEKYDG